jgi:hypothetical protein
MLAAAPAGATIAVESPHLTLTSTYSGVLKAETATVEPAPGEVEHLVVEEHFKVVAKQEVDNHGHTIVLRKVEEVTGSETGTLPNHAGGSEPVECVLSPGEGHRPAGFAPSAVPLKEPLEKEENAAEGREAFVGNPATDYAKFDLRTYLPTDSLTEAINEVATEKGAGVGVSAKSCEYARKTGGSVLALTCKHEATGSAGEAFAPQLLAQPLEEGAHPAEELELKGECNEGVSPGAAKEGVTIKASLGDEVEGAKAVIEAHEKEEAERLAEEEARKRKEAEERKRKEEEEARKVEVPVPPVKPPEGPKPPAEPPPEAVVAPEGRPPKRLTPAQLRRVARTRTSPSDRARNRALRVALAAAVKVKSAKCLVGLAIDGAVDAVSFVAPIPGEMTGGGSVTDLSTRRCLNLLAQTRAALVVANHDPPSPRYPRISLPARIAASGSLPCTPSALTAPEYAACNGLLVAEHESDRHLERVALVATAVAGTINRHSGAIRAGRQADAEFQDVAYNALVAELGQSLERASEANAAVAAALGAAGTDVTFGPALAAHTPRHLEQLIKRAKGGSRSALRTLLGAARLAVPSLPGSFRAALSAAVPVGSLADGGTFTPRELILLIRQLVKQGQIPPALGSAMVAELGALKKAKSAAATPLRQQLAAQIRQLTSEAGPLLEAATRIRSPRL